MNNKQNIPVQKTVYDKNSFSNVVDRDFNQLVPKQPQEEIRPQLTVEQFFQSYEELFFDIPKEGETNSHKYLIEQSSEYLGIKSSSDIDVRLLQEEITNLREQLLETHQILEQIKVTR